MKFLATHNITIVPLLALEVHYFLSMRLDIIPCLLKSVNVSVGRIPKILNIIVFANENNYKKLNYLSYAYNLFIATVFS